MNLRTLSPLAFVLFLSCHSTPTRHGPNVHVVAFAPSEPTDDPRAAIQWTFSAPVVSETQVGHDVPSGSVRVEPAFAFSARYRDRQTLWITPSENLRPATQYTVTLTPTFPAQMPDSEAQKQFVHAPLRIREITGADPDFFPAHAPFVVQFSKPVVPARAAEHCRFRAENEGGNEISVTLSEAAADNSTQVRLTPNSVLTAGQEYRLTCVGLTAAEGNAQLTDSERRVVHVYGPLRLTSSSPTTDDAPGADELELAMEFSTPVSIEAFRQAISITPSIADFGLRWVLRGHTRFAAVVNLESETHYDITLQGSLKDQFEQALGQPQHISFTTSRATPRVFMERGVYAIEAGGPGYGVWTRNVSSFEVTCAKVPATRVASVLTDGGTNVDPSFLHSASDINWSALGLTPVHFEVPTQQNRSWHLHHIDLGTRCGAGPRNGVVLAEVRSLDVEMARHILRGAVRPDAGTPTSKQIEDDEEEEDEEQEEEEDEGDWGGDDESYGYGSSDRYPYRVFGNVTDLGVVLKIGTTSGLVWVARASDGQPVASAQVSVFHGADGRVFSGTTDVQGLLRLPSKTELARHTRAPAAEHEYYDNSQFVVTVEKAGDTAVVHSQWQNGIQLWNFGVNAEYSGQGEDIRGFLLSDRGIYRPGETAHFKGFVRTVPNGGTPQLPRTRRVDVVLRDARGQEAVTRTVNLDAYGGFDVDYEIPSDAPLGDCSVTATLLGKAFPVSFSVEEFRPAAFEIVDSSPPRSQQHGTDTHFRASYLFGAPVQNASVAWDIYKRPRALHFHDLQSYQFSEGRSFWTSYYGEESESAGEFVTSGETETNNQGDFSVPAPRIEVTRPLDIILTVRVTDVSGQTISKRIAIQRDPTDRYLGLHTQEYIQAQGMPFAINAVVVDTQGHLQDGQATLRLLRQVHHCDQGRSSPWGGYGCRTEEQEVWSKELTLHAGGPVIERVLPREPGGYVIRLEGRDSAGRPIRASSGVYCVGEDEAFWSGDESARMTLIADKQEYNVGESARIVAQAGLSGGTALVTTERNGVIDATVVPVQNGVPMFEVPIRDAHVPNVYVSVAAVRGRVAATAGATGAAARATPPGFRMGIVNLAVGSSHKRLDVRIQTEQPTYRPGERVRGFVQVTHQGEPIVSSLSLSVADEGVLQLVNFQTPDPLHAFYVARGIAVQNATNWNRFARDRAPTDADESIGEDSGGEEEERTRSRFVSSAYWAPSLVTDATGRVAFEFDAPDNLTAFRLMAAVVDQGDRFGSADARIQIRKELLVTPVAPRFLQDGDTIELGAVVHNYTAERGRVTVRFNAPGLAIRQHQRTVDVPAQSSRRVNVEAHVEPGQRRVIAYNVSGEMAAFRDAFAIDIPIRSALDRNRHVVVESRMMEAGTRDVPITWSAPTVAASSSLEITLDRTGLSRLEPTLQSLVHYPYGCLEQTGSAVIGLSATRELAETLDFRQLENSHNLDAFLRAGALKISRFQSANGMFSLWEGGATNPHLTAFALWVLYQAKEAQARPSMSSVNRGLAALTRWANQQATLQPGNLDGATLAMSAHILSLWSQPNAALETRLFEQRANLDAFGKSHLLMALTRNTARRAEAATLAAELAAMPVVEVDRAFFRGTHDWFLENSGDLPTAALALMALHSFDANHPRVVQLIAGVNAGRDESSGTWHNTFDNSHAAMALARVLAPDARARTRVRVSLGDNNLLTQTLQGGRVARITRPLGNLTPGALRIESDGPLSYVVRLVEAVPLRETAESRGVVLERTLQNPDTHQPITTISPGDLIQVTVRVRAANRVSQLAVVDPVPSGAELVNLELATESVGHVALGQQSYRWTHHEFRDQEVRLFADAVHGELTYSYFLRATQAGSFTVPGTHAEAMYHPEISAALGRTQFAVTTPAH